MTALAARAGVLAQGNAIVDLGVVALVAGLGVDRIKGVGSVAAQAEGAFEERVHSFDCKLSLMKCAGSMKVA